MADVVRARDREIQLAGIGLGVGDELRQRLHRQVALDRDHLRAGADIGDRHELLVGSKASFCTCGVSFMSADAENSKV